MSDAGARDFHRRWASIAVPLRPPPEAVAAMAALIAGRGGRTLLLGVTPEIAGIAAPVIAVDWNERMVRLAWPAAAGRMAVVADWHALPIASRSIDTAIGDASLSVLAWPITAFASQLARVLAPGARIVLRCFANPEPAETLTGLREAVLAGDGGSFSAFKLRLNMAVFAAAGGVRAVASHELFAGFERLFPDRAALAGATGWTAEEIARIDSYAGSETLHAYPNRARILAGLPWPGRFVEVGGYELAERCPLLVVDVPR